MTDGDRPADGGRDDPYRWACPRGHVFQRSCDPDGVVECYSCGRTYDVDDLLDRRAGRTDPPWAP